MAVCDCCERDMLETTKCEPFAILINGTTYNRIPYGQMGGDGLAYYPDDRCHDCNVATGGHHHPGCDMERCPRCKGQLISCGCLDSSGNGWLVNGELVI